MIEVHRNLFVGDGLTSVSRIGDPDWFVISAAKEPWHRELLKYTGRAAPKDHPEYLLAYRPGRLVLNLVDVNDMAYIPDEIIATALTAIHAALADDRKVLVHCNQGHSRSPTIALLYLSKWTDTFKGKDYDEGVEAFKVIYPDYAPAKGMADYARKNWRQ